jgi:hypothetical protein
MSPEQGADQTLTGASDMYSVGAMLYEALTGRRPFEGPPMTVLTRKQTDSPPRPSTLAEVPGDLEALCLRLLDRVPARRPTASELLAWLHRTPTTAGRRHFEPERTALDARHDAAMAALRAGLVDSRDRLVMVVIGGPSRSGKTALLEAFRNEATGQGALVLAGRACAHEALDYRAADQMVDQLATWLLTLPAAEVAALMPPNIAALTRVFPVMQRVPAARRPLLPGVTPVATEEVRRQATMALMAVLGAIARTRPVVCQMDDGQWGTVAGGVMTEAFDTPDAPPILIVVAHRSEDTDSIAMRIAAGWRGDIRRVELASPGP